MANRNLDPERRCLPLDEWPEADRLAWERARTHADLLDEPGLAAHWKPKTVRTVISGYGRFLGFLDRQCWLDRETGPASRLTREFVGPYLEGLKTYISPVSLWGRATNLAEAFRVMVPGIDLRFLNRARQRLKTRARPIRNKRAQMVPASDLARLGLQLIRQADDREAGRGVHTAILYRDGLLILLLACRPLRRDNFAELRIGKEIVRGETSYSLAIAETDTKNHRAYDSTLDEALTPLIDRYIAMYRPALIGASPSDRLWMSQNKEPLSGEGIYGIIKAHTKAAFGKALSPHRFRDCAVTSLAAERPDLVWLSMSLLHQSDPRIAEKHYNQALTSQAVDVYQHSIRGIRRAAARSHHLRRPG